MVCLIMLVCYFSSHPQYQLVGSSGTDTTGTADPHVIARHHHQTFSRGNSGFVYGAPSSSTPGGGSSGATAGFGLRSPAATSAGGYVPGAGSEFLHHHHHLPTAAPNTSHHQAAPPPASPFPATSFPGSHHQAFYPYGPPQGPYYMSPR